jgi:hypothetical protein
MDKEGKYFVLLKSARNSGVVVRWHFTVHNNDNDKITSNWDCLKAWLARTFPYFLAILREDGFNVYFL